MPITHYLNESEKTSEFNLFLPNGSSLQLLPRKRKDRYILEFVDTRLPGIYELRDSKNVVAKFVVLPSFAESILEKAEEDEIASSASALTDRVIRIDGREGKGWESYLAMDSQRKFGRETWQILLAAVIGLIFVEIILLRKFGKMAR